MFNGIIYNTGIVRTIKKEKKSKLIGVKSNLKFKKKDIGSSICCSGVCLTLTKIKKGLLFFYISNETLKKTNFKLLLPLTEDFSFFLCSLEEREENNTSKTERNTTDNSKVKLPYFQLPTPRPQDSGRRGSQTQYCKNSRPQYELQKKKQKKGSKQK